MGKYLAIVALAAALAIVMGSGPPSLQKPNWIDGPVPQSWIQDEKTAAR